MDKITHCSALPLKMHGLEDNTEREYSVLLKGIESKTAQVTRILSINVINRIDT